MWPDRVSSPGPLTYESGALPIALSGPVMYSDEAHCEEGTKEDIKKEKKKEEVVLLLVVF